MFGSKRCIYIKGWGQLLMALFFLVFSNISVAGASEINLNKKGLALQGYDPVSYFQDSGPLVGSEALIVESVGEVYRFATEENREAFLQSPESYKPQFGGWCAWAMLDGEKVEINPEAYRIFEGKLLVFYDGFWGDTKERWIKKSKKDMESKLFDTASAMWTNIITSK